MEIVVTGRHTEIAERFRNHVEDKIVKVSPLTPNAQRIDVVVTREKNPRLSATAERVELTVRAKGPVIRAEASAEDRYAALDLAMGKLLERLRRVRDRRKTRRRQDTSGFAASAAEFESTLSTTASEEVVDAPETNEQGADEEAITRAGNTTEHSLGDSPVLIREKVHDAVPMSIDDALYEMELVGHDFFLFQDATTGRPSAVYRRRGWTYGVISLNITEPPTE
jgi:ribosomal subunit interface protein